MQSQYSKTSKPTHLLLSVDYETKLATDAEIIENCDTMKHLLAELDIAFSILRMSFGTPEQKAKLYKQCLKRRLLVKVKTRLWNVLGLSQHSPKIACAYEPYAGSDEGGWWVWRQA
jgi:hypothetical protein